MSKPDSSNTFYTLTARPKLIMLLSGLLVLFTAAGLTQLSKTLPYGHSYQPTTNLWSPTTGLMKPSA